MQVELFDQIYCLKDEFKVLKRKGECPSCLREVKFFSVPRFYGKYSRVNFCCDCYGIVWKPCRFGLNAPVTTYVRISYSDGDSELTSNVYSKNMHNVPISASHLCKVTGNHVEMTKYLKAKLKHQEMDVRADVFECPKCFQESLVRYVNW